MRSYEQRKGLLDDMRNQDVRRARVRQADAAAAERRLRTPEIAAHPHLPPDGRDPRHAVPGSPLGPSELPQVAELMDVREDQEHWRLAMNAAYGSMAQTILVDKRHERGFASQGQRHRPRTPWRGAPGSSSTSNAGEPGTGPAARTRVRPAERFSERCGCPEAALPRGFPVRRLAARADQLRASRRPVRRRHDDLTMPCGRCRAADGQIKSGKRGQHGIKDRQQVIDSSTSYLAQSRARASRTRNANATRPRNRTRARRNRPTARSESANC